jgi:exodeoxyribonuclease I
MAKTFFFYDLETSGLNPRTDRIMQFAGIRTDMNLKPIGEPYNIMVRATDDMLPSPEAVMVTGITPQMTLADGISEKEFVDLLIKDIFIPDTITVGFNSVRFDDEFIRHTLWRNFYDPYEWAWADGRSRWDLLDVVRMTRALRPDGIKWPVIDGKPVNKLELITKENGIDHMKAHDALSDVEALIDVTRLIKSHQPKLLEYLLTLRDKREVEKVVNLDDPKPFVYASGRYGGEFDFATVALPLCLGSKPGSVVVYDLRYDPSVFASMSKEDIATALFASKEERGDGPRIPVKELSFNKCPAVAPLGVLDAEAQKRLKLSIDDITLHAQHLKQAKDFLYAVRDAYASRPPYPTASDVESKLYDSFIDKKDLPRIAAVRSADASGLADFHPEFIDERLPELLLRYKARQFPSSLSETEQQEWEAYRSDKINKALPGYLQSLAKLAADGKDTFLLEELQLWAESIVPAND